MDFKTNKVKEKDPKYRKQLCKVRLKGRVPKICKKHGKASTK